jgi:hypothetical protein
MNIQKGAERAQYQMFYRHSYILRSQRSALRCQKVGLLMLALSTQCADANRRVPTISQVPPAPFGMRHPQEQPGVQMISVDAIQHSPDGTLPSTRWCHMATEGSRSELRQMTAKLGLRHVWFGDKPTHPHDDLTPAKRAQAIQLGAQAVSTHELLRRCYPHIPGNGLQPRKTLKGKEA